MPHAWPSKPASLRHAADAPASHEFENTRNGGGRSFAISAAVSTPSASRQPLCAGSFASKWLCPA